MTTYFFTDKTGDRRGTWIQALASLLGAVVFILAIRWALLEPYVIPSGSMIPSLLVHDHIFVNKFAYGIRLPFSSVWLLRFGAPKRGDVIVFRSLDDDGTYLVKRVVGLPGDKIWFDKAGVLFVNGHAVLTRVLPLEQAEQILGDWPLEQREALLESFELSEVFLSEGRKHLAIHRLERESLGEGPFLVPKDSIFMVGDNRDNSSDSRTWGALPVDKVLGRASLIWLSCEETLPDSNQLCDPKTVRWTRIFKRVR